MVPLYIFTSKKDSNLHAINKLSGQTYFHLTQILSVQTTIIILFTVKEIGLISSHSPFNYVNSVIPSPKTVKFCRMNRNCKGCAMCHLISTTDNCNSILYGVYTLKIPEFW